MVLMPMDPATRIGVVVLAVDMHTMFAVVPQCVTMARLMTMPL
jgi:hypothetical protein